MSYIQQEFGNEQRWINWKYEERDGRQTKVPKNPRTGGNAMANNQSTWSDYKTARSKSDKIGIQLGLTAGNIIGIDIDHTLTDTKALQLLEKANTYTEISPSGNGLRLFLKTETPYTLLRNRKDNFEVYNSVRFLTVTEAPFENYNRPIRTVLHEELTSILEIMGYPWGNTEEVSKPVLNYSTSTLTDQEVLNIMFRSKNGKKIEQLYSTTGTTGSSEDDMSLCSHLAFYCDGYDQIERIWVSSPLGSRDKTRNRKDYRQDTINKAIKSCKDHYKPSERTMVKKEFVENMKEDELELLYVLDKNNKKITIVNTENVCRILKYHPEFNGKLRYDSFKNIFEICKDNKWQEFQEHESINIQTRISVLFPSFIKVTKAMVEDALSKVIHDNEINSIAEYFKSLKWDRTPRLDSWLSKVFGVEDDEYHKSIGSNWLKGLVNRGVNPGCKFDYVLVIEGRQGSLKTSALAELGNIQDYNAHVEITGAINNKDFLLKFAGKIIVEFSEGDSLSRSETKQLKSIITDRYDNYREPYARKSKDHPRQCVFAMTTNEDTYLKDDTGNRRWLPVKAVSDESNIQWIKDNREQLYAEAYHRVIELKETTWEFPKELLEEAQDARRIEDTNADMVTDWYLDLLPYEREQGVTIREVFNATIKKQDSFKVFEKIDEMRLAGILRGTLKLTKERVTIEGKKCIKWFDKYNKYNSRSLKPEEEKKEIRERDNPYAPEFVDEAINKITTQWEK